MYASKVLMEWAPNVHFLGALTMVYTLVYRWKALYPIYTYVLLNGLFAGFSAWWLPYLYIWDGPLGGDDAPPTAYAEKGGGAGLYACLRAARPRFGTLYAPAQALMFGLNFKGMVAWIIAGLPWDLVHGLGNLAAGVLIVPLTALLKRADKASRQAKL